MTRQLTGQSVNVYLQAREILAIIGPDPDAATHRVELGKAIGATCRITDCDRDTRARGLCGAHYQRQRRATVEAFTVNRLARRKP